jgi:hypothetical protein
MVCDANGVPLHFFLSPGQASDISNAQALLDPVRIPGKQGRPRKRCRWLLADKDYDAEQLRQYCDRYRMQPVIPMRTMKRKPKPGQPRLFDRPKYRHWSEGFLMSWGGGNRSATGRTPIRGYKSIHAAFCERPGSLSPGSAEGAGSR